MSGATHLCQPRKAIVRERESQKATDKERESMSKRTSFREIKLVREQAPERERECEKESVSEKGRTGQSVRERVSVNMCVLNSLLPAKPSGSL